MHQAASLRAWAHQQLSGVRGCAQVRQGAEVAHELDEWEEVHVEDADGVGAAYTRRRTVFGKISCGLPRHFVVVPMRPLHFPPPWLALPCGALSSCGSVLKHLVSEHLACIGD